MDACVGRVSGQDSFQSERELMILTQFEAVCLKMWRETEKGFLSSFEKALAA